MEKRDQAVAFPLHRRQRPLEPGLAVAAIGSPPLGIPLLISAVRCILRYIVLPFALPLVGVAAGAALGVVTAAGLGVLLTVDMIAATAIVAALRRLWRLHHPRRWQYLPVGLALLVLMGVFLVNDARLLLT